MDLNFSSKAPEEKNFMKSVGKIGRNVGNAAKKVLPVAQKVLPIASVFVPALRPVATIVDAIPSNR